MSLRWVIQSAASCWAGAALVLSLTVPSVTVPRPTGRDFTGGSPASADGDTAVRWRQLDPPTSAPPTHCADLAYDAETSRLVLFGGREADGHYQSGTWAWDGVSWSELHPARHPAGRACPTMAYDEARNEIVLFGGRRDTDLGDTWTFADGEWSRHRPATSPGEGQDEVMGFDPVRQQVILFGGGTTESRHRRQTWAWDGATWTRLHPETSPRPRTGAGLAYDADRDALVLFGGYDEGRFRHDTWQWDGATWVKVPVAGHPSGRADFGMSSFGPGVALFGGQTASSFAAGGTWLLGISGWERAEVETSPLGRRSTVLGWDAARGVAMMFGGSTTVPLGDTWTLSDDQAHR